MPAQFNGLKNVGKKAKGLEQSQDTKATVSWTVTVNAAVTADGPAGNISVPGVGILQGWKYSLNPVDIPVAFTFGTTKAIGTVCQQPKSNVLATAAGGFVAGRIFMYVEATGQLFEFCSANDLLLVTNASAGNYGLWIRNSLVPVHGSQNGKVDIFVEQDNLNGVLQTPGPNTFFNVLLFNYEAEPVGVAL